MSMSRRLSIAALLLTVIAGAQQLSCSSLNFSGDKAPGPDVAPAVASGPPQQISIAAVGDLLIHDSLQSQAARSPNTFRSLWKRVVPYLQHTDLTYANLEGPSANGIDQRGNPRM